MDTSISQPVGPSTQGAYSFDPPLPSGVEVTTSGALVINGRLDIDDGGLYRITAPEINGSIVFELIATG